MNLSTRQKRIIEQIVSVFETGGTRRAPWTVTVLEGDKGHLSYGMHQASLASGNLGLLLERYTRSGGQYSRRVHAYLDRVQATDTSLDHDAAFRDLLYQAGHDPVMRMCQQDFFDRLFLEPAVQWCKARGYQWALTAAVVYDGKIHGSFESMAVRAAKQVGYDDEQAWVVAYLKTRRDWLARKRGLLAKTVYRPEAFLDLVEAKNWSLNPPLTVRGLQVTGDTKPSGLKHPEAVAADASGVDTVLRLRTPAMGGCSVIKLRALLGMPEKGTYNKAVYERVVEYQRQNGLTVDGIVGPQTWAHLAQSHEIDAEEDENNGNAEEQ